MGVLSCSKVGCNHIMCHTYVPGVGYICSDCQNDFKEWLTRSPLLSMENEYDIQRALIHWLDIPRADRTIAKINIDEFFHQYSKE